MNLWKNTHEIYENEKIKRKNDKIFTNISFFVIINVRKNGEVYKK